MPRRENKEYYAVLNGRQMKQPTIFSSWARAHLRVTGFPKAEHKSFVKLQDAKDYMHTKGIINYAQDIESENENTTPERGDAAFYAVAHGKAPGVYRYYEYVRIMRLYVLVT
ncbi:hypothetical protein LTR10_011125 [Elasticomyces elasticus]|nr:hypothetical protein LTR10_011125 [Elasticomyces elasticus]KAK4966455.1 hypothetical protein LTR42_011620 [Elasticomyces elasticus]